MNKLILFLIRRKLGVKKNELFRFTNQKTDAVYYFSDRNLFKILDGVRILSNVKINWLFNKKCKVEPLKRKINKSSQTPEHIPIPMPEIKSSKRDNKKYNKNITKTRISTKSDFVSKKKQ